MYEAATSSNGGRRTLHGTWWARACHGQYCRASLQPGEGTASETENHTSQCPHLHILHLQAAYCTRLDDGAHGDARVLDDYHDAILDDKALVLAVGLLDAVLVDNLALGPDARVLVNDRLRLSMCTPTGTRLAA